MDKKTFVKMSASHKVSHTYYRIPKLICTDVRFSGLSDKAKLIYSILLSLVWLSAKNGWADGDGRVYVICSRNKMKELLGKLSVGINQIGKYYSELAAYGLMDEVSCGFGQSARIYVKNFEASAPEAENEPGSLSYIYKGQEDNFSYFEFPTYFLSQAPFCQMQVGELLLYVILLDRLDLSRRNNHVDENGDLFVNLTQEEAAAFLGCTVRNVQRYFKRLEENGLANVVQMFSGIDSRIYIFVMAEFATRQNSDCGHDKTVIADTTKQLSRTRQNSGHNPEYNKPKNIQPEGSSSSASDDDDESNLSQAERKECYARLAPQLGFTTTRLTLAEKRMIDRWLVYYTIGGLEKMAEKTAGATNKLKYMDAVVKKDLAFAYG
jgi:hypothetical protein